MKKILLAWLMLLRVFTISANPYESVYSGKITSEYPVTHLKLIYYPSYCTMVHRESKIKDVEVTKDGRFETKIICDSRFYRVQIVTDNDLDLFTGEDYKTSENVQIGVPGDNIFMSVKIMNNKIHLNVSGKGFVKYEIGPATNFKTSFDNKTSPKEIDEFLLKRLTKIEPYKSRLEPDVYMLIYSDIKGKTYKAALLNTLSEAWYYSTQSDSIRNILNEKFNQYNLSLKRFVTSSQEISSYSFPMIDCLFYLNKFSLLIKEHERLENTTFSEVNSKVSKNLFSLIMTNYAGKLRDQLIGYFFSLGLFDTYVEPTTYKNWLTMSIQVVNETIIKNKLAKYLNTRACGAIAFDFDLPIETSSSRLKLSQLKGNIVLMDMWPYQCGGCMAFATAFHNSIFTKLKDFKDFKMVSIMNSPKTDKKDYLKRLKHVGSSKEHYTFPEYINLFSGKGEENMAHELSDWYEFDYAPVLVLIDREGKVISTTLPYFSEVNDPNVDKFYELIIGALTTKK